MYWQPYENHVALQKQHKSSTKQDWKQNFMHVENSQALSNFQ